MRLTRTAWLFLSIPALCLLATRAPRADVVLRGEQAVDVASSSMGDDLWVSAADLTRISGFVVKPEGACLDAICVPLPEGSGLVQREPELRVNASGLARRLEQPYAVDRQDRVWSFGAIPSVRSRQTASAVAPDFELRDRKGQPVRLSDFRGRKVLLVTWASWCACRDDVPIWQGIYEELRGKGLEIISAAQDSGGESAAGPIFDAAKVTYTSVVDVNHTVTALFDLVNVPAAVWIDESGHIVRRDDGAYPEQRTYFGVEVGVPGYVDALRDWVAKGEQSPFVLRPEQLAGQLATRGPDVERAKANFRLGTYFYQRGDGERATQYWEVAQSLDPDNWNYRRQEWTDSRFEARYKMLGRALGRALLGRSYYEPIALEPKPAH
jgi:peroxiredoxin